MIIRVNALRAEEEGSQRRTSVKQEERTCFEEKNIKKKKGLTKPIDSTLKKTSLKTRRSVRPTYLKVRKKKYSKGKLRLFQ